MFTGIIEEQGTIEKIVRRDNLVVLYVKADKVLKGIQNGDSVAVNGCCLTVTGRKGKILSFDMMRETLEATTGRVLNPRTLVNLERAMKVDSRFGGHFVTGHVDSIGVIRKIVKLKNYVEFEVALPKTLMKFLVAKGSVTLDGVSLTVGRVKRESFLVYLIPATLRITTLGKKKVGDQLTIETDILARYILR